MIILKWNGCTENGCDPSIYRDLSSVLSLPDNNVPLGCADGLFQLYQKLHDIPQTSTP